MKMSTPTRTITPASQAASGTRSSFQLSGGTSASSPALRASQAAKSA